MPNLSLCVGFAPLPIGSAGARMTRQFAPRLLRRFSHFGLNLAFGFEVVQCCVGFQARDFDFPIRQEIGILKVLGASSAYILNWLFQEALIIAIPERWLELQ